MKKCICNRWKSRDIFNIASRVIIFYYSLVSQLSNSERERWLGFLMQDFLNSDLINLYDFKGDCLIC
jgi:hypothetical protein